MEYGTPNSKLSESTLGSEMSSIISGLGYECTQSQVHPLPIAAKVPELCNRSLFTTNAAAKPNSSKCIYSLSLSQCGYYYVYLGKYALD
jgi:hypothetical protein